MNSIDCHKTIYRMVKRFGVYIYKDDTVALRLDLSQNTIDSINLRYFPCIQTIAMTILTRAFERSSTYQLFWRRLHSAISHSNFYDGWVSWMFDNNYEIYLM
jgi:hypothetical protein